MQKCQVLFMCLMFAISIYMIFQLGEKWSDRNWKVSGSWVVRFECGMPKRVLALS